MLKIFALGAAVKHHLVADDLHRLGERGLGQFPDQLFGLGLAVFEYRDLDEFPRLQRLERERIRLSEIPPLPT